MIPAARKMRTRDAPGELEAGKTSKATSRVSCTTNFFRSCSPGYLFRCTTHQEGFICGTLSAEPVTGGDEQTNNGVLAHSVHISHHMSSVLHLYACVCVAILLASIANRFLSKPFDRSTPSQRYPGRMLNLLGGGSGPLYIGFSVKEKNN